MTDSAFHLRADDRIDRPVVALFAAYARPHVRVLIPAIVASLAFPLVALVPVYLLHTAIDRVLLAEEPFVFLGGPPPIVSDPLLGHLLMIAGLMIAATTLAAVLSVVSTLGWGDSPKKCNINSALTPSRPSSVAVSPSSRLDKPVSS